VLSLLILNKQGENQNNLSPNQYDKEVSCKRHEHRHEEEDVFPQPFGTPDDMIDV
jgi:hypothetical protein